MITKSIVVLIKNKQLKALKMGEEKKRRKMKPGERENTGHREKLS